jgi:hypothetical protein
VVQQSFARAVEMSDLGLMGHQINIPRPANRDRNSSGRTYSRCSGPHTLGSGSR